MSDDETTFLVRQGFWLRAARERAGKSQKGAAEQLGLSGNSKSSISDYENGVTPASQITLRRLAKWYGVPVSLLTEPAETPEERIVAIVHLAGEQERRDSVEGQALDLEADGEPRGGHGRRSS